MKTEYLPRTGELRIISENPEDQFQLGMIKGKMGALCQSTKSSDGERVLHVQVKDLIAFIFPQ